MAGQKWYPSKEQLGTPEKLERALREVLRLHYGLQEQVKAVVAGQTAPPAGSAPEASNPATQTFCGIPVAPIDTNSLADGATLKYVKAQGRFKFS